MKRAFWILVIGAIGSAAMAVTLSNARETPEPASQSRAKGSR